MHKLLWHSNAPWVATGYGSQTDLFVGALKEHYELAVSSFYGLEGAPINWHGVAVLPGVGGTFGSESLPLHAPIHFQGSPRGGLLMTLMDVWVLDPQVMAKFNTVSWVPVDHEPVSPSVRHYFLMSGAVPMAMSRFGQEELAEFEPLYVPHAVDCEVFKPQDRTVARATLGVPEDAFVVGMVAANKGRPSRKSFQQAFEAFRVLRQKHENAYLYLHTIANAEATNGEDLPALLASLEIPEESVRFGSQYRLMYMPWSQQEMALVHSAFDVLLNPATGEGFGVPIVEAQACGVPAIVSDFTAMREVCGSGWKVPVRPWWTPQNSWQGIPDVLSLVDALEECYDRDSAKVKAMSREARNHALNYALPKVLNDHMLPALKEAEARFGQPVEVTT